MKRVFVDSSAWYAYARREDLHHPGVREAFRAWKGRLVTTNFVCDEVLTLTQKRLGHSVAVRIGEAIRTPEVVETVRLLGEDEDEAWDVFARHQDKGYSFTDCTSFVVMRRLGIETALATDRHFRQAGFAVVP